MTYLQWKGRWSGLPLNAEDLWDFCLDCGHKASDNTRIGLSAKTLKKYLFGIKAWHVFHGKEYPNQAKDRLDLTLRACGRADAIFPVRQLKKAVHTRHVIFLYEQLNGGSAADKALLDLLLVSLWGMVTYD